MPATSEKQKRFMDAAAHNPAFAKQAGVPVSVAKDFSKASKGVKFGASGSRADSQVANRPKTNQGKNELFSKGGTMATKKPMPKGLFGGKESMSEELKEAKAIKSGKISPMQYARGEKSEPMKHGGSVKKMANGGITSAKMGTVRTAAPSRDGIASKGKTKGTMVKMGAANPLGMRRGGKC
jgi:hypothetical protein